MYKVRVQSVVSHNTKDGHLKAGHDKAFKPAKHFRINDYKALYDHMADFAEVKKNYKDADGHVKIAPKNYYTNPNRVGENGK